MGSSCKHVCHHIRVCTRVDVCLYVYHCVCRRIRALFPKITANVWKVAEMMKSAQ